MLQKAAFYAVKGCLLQRKKRSFAIRRSFPFSACSLRLGFVSVVQLLLRAERAVAFYGLYDVSPGAVNNSSVGANAMVI